MPILNGIVGHRILSEISCNDFFFLAEAVASTKLENNDETMLY